MKKSATFILPLFLALTGCATVSGPAEVSGDIAARTDMVVSSAIILEVDGKPIDKKVANLQSGLRNVKIMALPTSGFRGGETREVQLNLKACTRYFLAVKRKNSQMMDWEPAVIKEEPIAGCEAK
jgi:hypothetical protein